MDTENFIAEFKKTFVYDMLKDYVTDERLFDHSIVDGQVVWMKEQARQMWSMWQAAKAQAVPDGFVVVSKEPNKQFKNVLSHYLDGLCRGGYGCDLDGFVSVNGIDPNEIWQFMIEAQEQTND